MSRQRHGFRAKCVTRVLRMYIALFFGSLHISQQRQMIHFAPGVCEVVKKHVNYASSVTEPSPVHPDVNEQVETAVESPQSSLRRWRKDYCRKLRWCGRPLASWRRAFANVDELVESAVKSFRWSKNGTTNDQCAFIRPLQYHYIHTHPLTYSSGNSAVFRWRKSRG